jgi:hypothetical protein
MTAPQYCSSLIASGSPRLESGSMHMLELEYIGHLIRVADPHSLKVGLDLAVQKFNHNSRTQHASTKSKFIKKKLHLSLPE